MIFGVYLFYYLFDIALFVNQKGYSVGTHVLAAVHAFFNPGAIGFMDAFAFVGNQVKRQTVFVGKFIVRLYAVAAYTNYFNALCLEAHFIVAKVTGLGGTTGSIVLWVKVQRYFFALKLIEADGFALLVEATEGWCLLANLWSAHSILKLV